MRVVDNQNQKVCELGLFENSGRAHAIKIRLLELPLIFGKLGVDVGYLEAWEGDDESVISYSLDLDADRFFELPDPFEDICYSPEAALKAIICSSPRFRAVSETDKLEA